MTDPGDVWEATVAIAVRDSQWLFKPREMVTPGTYVHNDGVPEERMGDAEFEAAERFFLLELKATRARIKSEWQRQKRRTDASGKSHKVTIPKHAYLSVRGMADTWLTEPTNDLIRATMLRSLLAHHFVYWDPVGARDDIAGNGLTVEPYLMAVLALRGPIHLRDSVFDHFKLADANKPVLDRFSGPHTLRSTLPISVLHEGRGCIFETKGQAAQSTWLRHPLGLTKEQFQEYVNFLTSSGPPEGDRMHAVVLTSTGRFVRVVTCTKDLSVLFSPAFEQKARPTSNPRTPPASPIIHYQPPSPVPPGLRPLRRR